MGILGSYSFFIMKRAVGFAASFVSLNPSLCFVKVVYIKHLLSGRDGILGLSVSADKRNWEVGRAFFLAPQSNRPIRHTLERSDEIYFGVELSWHFIISTFLLY